MSSRTISRSSTVTAETFTFSKDRLEGIQKYAGADAKVPKLNKLGGTRVDEDEDKGPHGNREIAKELVELMRRVRTRRDFSTTDTVWQKENEEMFP